MTQETSNTHPGPNHGSYHELDTPSVKHFKHLTYSIFSFPQNVYLHLYNHICLFSVPPGSLSISDSEVIVLRRSISMASSPLPTSPFHM